MSITVRCEECGWETEAQDSFAAKTFRCKECKAKIDLPEGDSETYRVEPPEFEADPVADTT